MSLVKKYPLIMLLFLAAQSAFGQMEENQSPFDSLKWQLGLNLGFDRTSGENTDVERSVSLIPQIGRMLGNKTLVGFGLGYASSSGGTSAFDSKSLIANSYIRRFKRIEKNVYAFLQFELEFQAGRTDGVIIVKARDNGNVENNSPYEFHIDAASDFQSYQVGIRPGLMYLISRSWLAELSLSPISFRQTKHTGSEAYFEDVERVNLAVDFTNMALGVKYLF